ncbi:MAG: hypothetical protein EPO28_17990 [Saprospiraceae bacterium]|nr:MAG: hypothetical protein EPO28_17990 [Saprospiraceae bacterium]
MKWFCHIFALYLIALSCLPCSDGDSGHGRLSSETSSAVQSASQTTGHQHGNDLCSPLCTCACCGSVVTTLHFTPTISKPAISSTKKIAFYNSSFIQEVYLSIWQPPKIS